MHASPEEFLQGIAGFLGAYYICLAMMNGLAALYVWQSRSHGYVSPAEQLTLAGAERTQSSLPWRELACLTLAIFYTVLAPLAASGNPNTVPRIPGAARDFIDYMMGPVVYSVGTLVILLVMFVYRRFFVKPAVAWTLLNLSLFFMGLSMADKEFADIVTKPDNVPIVALIFLLGFFTWLASYQAVRNDERIAEGLPPVEKETNEKVLVWPDLVYTELICMVAVTAVLLLWGIGLQAPLEEAATAVKTPNPSKAPWYFLGLQEMLVYFDPWYAGVVLPSLSIFGLMAIPYMDFNRKGNGYFTINERKFSYLVFQFGFLVLWVTLIILGTFLRGPNWNFFGPYEEWDPHKVLNLNNVHLYQIFWEQWLGVGAPRADLDAGTWTQIGYILVRESPGLIFLVLYFGLLPPLLAATVFRTFFVRMGFIRYMVMINLFLFMATLPIKMVLRWSFNMKYIVQIPEYFFNF